MKSLNPSPNSSPIFSHEQKVQQQKIRNKNRNQFVIRPDHTFGLLRIAYWTTTTQEPMVTISEKALRSRNCEVKNYEIRRIKMAKSCSVSLFSCLSVSRRLRSLLLLRRNVRSTAVKAKQKMRRKDATRKAPKVALSQRKADGRREK